MSDALCRVTDSDAIFTNSLSIASHVANFWKTRHYASPVTHRGNRVTQ